MTLETEKSVDMAAEPAAQQPEKGPILMYSPGFAEWLARIGGSLALTTYQAGRLFFIGRKADGGDPRPRAADRAVPGAVDRRHDAVDQRQVDAVALRECAAAGRDDRRRRRCANSCRARAGSPARHRHPRHRRRQIDGARGRSSSTPLSPASPRSARARASGRSGSRVSSRRLLPEDRCHLNGLAMDGGAPGLRHRGQPIRRRRRLARSPARRRRGHRRRFAARSWRAACRCRIRRGSIDGRLWLLNSGTGEFGTLDPAGRPLHTGLLLPRLCARARLHRQATRVIGLSRPRHNQTFDGLALDERLAEKDAATRAAACIDRRHRHRRAPQPGCASSTRSTELYDVAVTARRRAGRSGRLQGRGHRARAAARAGGTVSRRGGTGQDLDRTTLTESASPRPGAKS